ncbi:MAG: ABC transporter permease [Dehalococcoidia bacterium]|nr:ABC transporter permease [Dehalococcoidia bacterium]
MLAADVTHRSIHVWRRNRDVFLHLWKSELSWPAVEPMLIMIGFGFGLGTFVELEGDQDYLQFLVPGLLAVYPMFAAISECGWGSYARMSMQHTFDAMMATPVSVDDIITGEILSGASRAVLSTFYILLVALVLTPWFDLIESPLFILALPLAIIHGFMFAALSLAYTGQVRSMNQLMYFFTLVALPMFYLGDVFFPLDELPSEYQAAAWFLPITHVTALDRALVTGDFEVSLLIDLVWLLVASAGAWALALWSMRRRMVA